jgi:hypothetical protein
MNNPGLPFRVARASFQEKAGFLFFMVFQKALPENPVVIRHWLEMINN